VTDLVIYISVPDLVGNKLESICHQLISGLIWVHILLVILLNTLLPISVVISKLEVAQFLLEIWTLSISG